MGYIDPPDEEYEDEDAPTECACGFPAVVEGMCVMHYQEYLAAEKAADEAMAKQLAEDEALRCPQCGRVACYGSCAIGDERELDIAMSATADLAYDAWRERRYR